MSCAGIPASDVQRVKLVAPSVPHVWVKIHYSWDVNEAVMHVIDHRRSCVAPSLFYAGPSKRIQHGCDAQVPAVLPGDKAGYSLLDHFEQVQVLLSIRVPDCGGLFHDRPDHGLIAPCFDVHRAASHVP